MNQEVLKIVESINEITPSIESLKTSGMLEATAVEIQKMFYIKKNIKLN